MSRKAISLNQLVRLKRLAWQMGVDFPDFERVLTNGELESFLVKTRIEAGGIRSPNGARLYRLRVRIKQRNAWGQSVKSGAPDTRSTYIIWGIEHLYPCSFTRDEKTSVVDFILLNYPNSDGNLEPALEWAKRYGLSLTTPREVFALSERKPKLFQELADEDLRLVATSKCEYVPPIQSAVLVRWGGSFRYADIYNSSNFSSASSWFVFRC